MIITENRSFSPYFRSDGSFIHPTEDIYIDFLAAVINFHS